MNDPGARRVYFIDWLRTLAVFLLLPFHTLIVFEAGNPYYVKASTLSEVPGGVIGFIAVWHMPLLFFLAGCSTRFALRKRSGSQYAWERIKRLLVPLVFGILILVPPLTWYGGRFNSGYADSYRHYLASGDFLRWNIQGGHDFYGGFGTGQLWFIMFLLVMSLVALPLVLWGARGGGVQRMKAFSRRLARPAWWPLPIFVLFAGGAVPSIPGGPFALYLFLFLLGFVAACDPMFMESAQRFRLQSLVGGVALTLFTVLTPDLRTSLPDPSFQLAGLVFLRVAAIWLIIMGLLGFGKRYLDRPSRAQKYLAESSYPIYILHQTVIVIIAFYMVRMATPAAAQWVALLVAAVAGTFALYEIVRWIGPLRFLFGMRPRTRKATKPSADSPARGA